MSTNSNNPTTMIKSKFSNEVHKILEPNVGVKARDRWRLKKKPLTDAEKLELFDKIVEAHANSTNELVSYLYQRREKKRIQKARVERGWVPKVKTKKVV